MKKVTTMKKVIGLALILAIFSLASSHAEAPTPYTCQEHGALTEEEIIPFSVWEVQEQLCIHCVWRFAKNHSLVVKKLFKEAAKRRLFK